MCLTHVDSTELEEVEGEGWKAIYSYPLGWDSLFPFSFPPVAPPPYTYNTWIQRIIFKTVSGVAEIISDDSKAYPPGFHLFPTEMDALEYMHRIYRYIDSGHNSLKVVKVKYKNVLARGSQDGLPCIVAEYIYIEQEEV